MALSLADPGNAGSIRPVPPVSPPTTVPRAYEYRCFDRSLLVPWISRGPATWLHARIPAPVSANAVTVAGSLLVWVTAAAVLVVPHGWRERLGPVWVLALALYCVLDHVDGQRARRHGTSSATGEFLDHALDAWNVGLVILIVAAMGPPGVHAPGAVLALLAAAGAATFGTWLEQHERGAIYLGRIGPVEGLVAACLYVLAWSWAPAADWLVQPAAVDGPTRATLILALAAAGNAMSALAGAWRVRVTLRPWLEAVALFALLVLAGAPGWAHAAVVMAALVISTATWSGRVIAAHLNGWPVPAFDRSGLLLLLVVAVAEYRGLVGRAWEAVPLAWLAATAVRPWFAMARAGHFAGRAALAVTAAGTPTDAPDQTLRTRA